MATFTNELKLDVGPMLKSLQEASNKAQEAGRQIQDGIVKGIRAGSDEAKNLSAAFQNVQQSAGKSVTELRNSIAALIAAGKGSGAAFDELVAELKTADAEAKKLKTALQEVDKLVVEVPVEIDVDQGQLTKTTSDIKSQLSQGLSGFGAGLTGGLIGGGVAGAAQAVLGTIKDLTAAAFDEYKKLDTNIQNIGTLGVEASGLSLDRFRELATQLSTELPDSASNIANGIYNAISAGITGTEEDIAKFVGIAGKVAVAGLSDTNTAVNALTSVVNAYGLGVEGAEEVSNTFFAAIKAGKTSFSELNAGLANVVPAASAAGIGFNEVAGSIAKLTTVGIPTAQATTQLRSAIVELQKPAKPLADALAKIGLNAANMGAELAKPREEGGGLVNVLQRLEKSAADSGQSLTQIFGSAEAASAALALTGKNAESTNAILAGVNADIADNVAEKAFEAAAQSIEVKFSILKNNLQAGFNTIFQAIVPVFSTVIGLFTDTLGPALSEAFGAVKGAFTEVFSIIKPILLAIGGIIIANIINTIQVAAQTIRVVYTVFANTLKALKNAFQPVVDAIAAAFGSDGALGEGFDIVEEFKKALSAFGDILSGVGDVLIEIGSLVIEYVVTPFQILGNIIAVVITKFREWFGSQKDSNKETEKGKGAIDRLREAFQNIRGTIAGVTEAFQTIKKTIGDFFNALANFDLRAAIEAFSGFGQKVKQAYDKGFASVAAGDVAKEQAKAAASEYDKLVKSIEKASKAAESQSAGVVKKVRGELTEALNVTAKAANFTKEQYKDLADQIAAIQAGAAAPPPADNKKSAEDAIKRAKDLFAIRQAILKTEQETATTAILAQGLEKEAERVALKKLELETQRKITESYREILGTSIKINEETGEQRVISVAFKTDDRELAEINTQLQNFLQAEIKLQAELTLQPKELEKSVADSLKFFNEAFKKNAKQLTEGVIDPKAFETNVENLRGSFASLRKGLEEALNNPQVKASPALAAAYEEQILLVGQKLAELNIEAIETTDRVFIASQKTQLENNKRRLEVLKIDERANAEEIFRIREEIITLETNLKLAAIKTTGQAREDETRLILREAQKQSEALEASASKSGGLFKGLAKDFSKVVTSLDFSEVFNKTKDDAEETATAIVDSLKSGTIAYQSAVVELEGLATESTSTLDKLFKQLAKSFQKIADSSIDSLSSISAGFKGSEEDIKELLTATASAAASGFAAILVSGEDFGKSFVLLILDILDATIPALVALILGQSFAANPLLGAVVAAALIATLKGAVAVAKAAANGFEEGGYTGDVGTKQVAGVVHGQEYVINAKATKKFRPVLEEMNKGRMPMIDNGEFSAMRAELSAIRKRLDGMPNGIQGSQAVRLDVGFDNYIYERDRRRMALRGLRG